MGETKYTKAKRFLDELKKTDGNIIDFNILKRRMQLKIGADESRTVKPYIRFMLDFGMISEEGDNVRIN